MSTLFHFSWFFWSYLIFFINFFYRKGGGATTAPPLLILQFTCYEVVGRTCNRDASYEAKVIHVSHDIHI